MRVCGIRGPLHGPGTDDPICGKERVSDRGMCTEHETETAILQERDAEQRECEAVAKRAAVLKKIKASQRAAQRRRERNA